MHRLRSRHEDDGARGTSGCGGAGAGGRRGGARTGLDAARGDRPRHHAVEIVADEPDLRMQHDAAGRDGKRVHRHDLGCAGAELEGLELQAEEDGWFVVAQDGA